MYLEWWNNICRSEQVFIPYNPQNMMHGEISVNFVTILLALVMTLLLKFVLLFFDSYGIDEGRSEPTHALTNSWSRLFIYQHPLSNVTNILGFILNLREYVSIIYTLIGPSDSHQARLELNNNFQSFRSSSMEIPVNWLFPLSV